MTLHRDAESPVSSPLLAYLAVLRRRWLVAVSVAILTIACGVVFAAIQTRVYQAAATVVIDPIPPRVVNITEVTTDTVGASPEYYATQYKLISSRPVVEKVIADLNLGKRLPELDGARDTYQALIWSDKLIVDAVKNTRLVMVRFEDPDPKLATEVANAIAEQYVKYGLEVKQAEA